MNWLAHLVLSEPAPAFRVGNVLADLLPIAELRALPEDYQPGIARHRAIDRFTDTHPIVRRSIGRLDPTFRRFGGVVMDIFYDHLLTTHWTMLAADAALRQIGDFVAAFHDDVEACRTDIPAGAYAILQRMRTGNWLTTYGDVAGVRLTLNRISQRLRRPFDLGAATRELETHYAALTEDFVDFFPQIRKHFGHLG